MKDLHGQNISKVAYTKNICTCKMLNIGYVSNETNEDVRMYIEEFILVDLDTLLHKVEVLNELNKHW